MSQDINTQNSQPDQTAPSTTVGSRVFCDSYNSGRDHESTTGKHSLGLMDPQDAQGELKPTLESIEAGAQAVSLEELVLGWGGNMTMGIQDSNPNAMEVAVGTTASKVRDTSPTTPVTGVVAASGSTLATIKLATGDAADFSGHEGELIEIPTAAGITMRNYIQSVNTTTDVITTRYPMDEIPLAAGTVHLREGFVQEVGGGQMLQREFIFRNDFANGASNIAVLWRGQPVGGWKANMGKGKVKQMLDIKIQGHSRTVDGLLQQVPLTIYGKYGKAPLAV